jgi:N utilization substance protein A
MNVLDDLFKSLHLERGVDRDGVISGIEAALLAAYRSSAGAANSEYARVIFDPETGEMLVERLRDLHSGDLPRPGIDVVDGPNGREIAVIDWERLPAEERETFALDQARFGRVAAAAAKEALRRDVRGSEQRVLHARYDHRIGTLVEGVVGERISAGLLVRLADADAVLPFGERAGGPMPRTGELIAAVIAGVALESEGAQITLSQTDSRFVEAVFASEILEVSDGRIKIVRMARRPGVRTKVAVANSDEQRHHGSAVGACVGERGSRIRRIRDVLGEELDLIAFDADPLVLVESALSPARVRRVEADGAGFVAVVSEEAQADVAGPDGLGLELASELVGAPITLRVESDAMAQRADEPTGVCAYIRPNGRRCVNAVEPGSNTCGLPGHQVA